MIYDSLKRTFSEISKHKVFFIILVVIQTLFIVAFAFTFLTFHLKILEDTRGIIEPLQDANYDPDSVDQGKPFLDNPLEVYQSYRAMIKNIYNLIAWLLFLFIIFNGILWTGSHFLLNDQKITLKRIISYFSKFTISFLALIIPFLILCYYLIRNVIFRENPTELFSSYAKIVGVILLIVYYLALVAFSNMAFSWKEFLKRSLKKAKKLTKTIPILLVNVLLISLGIYIIYYSLINLQETMIILATFLLIVIFVITRLYWIICINYENIP